MDPDANALDSPDLKHFLDLVNGGVVFACNEAAANTLALTVLDHVGYLDDSALRGLCTFIGITKVEPRTAYDLVKQS